MRNRVQGVIFAYEAGLAPFDRELDRAAETIASAVSRMDRERMAEEADAFTVALERDLIDAAAFER